MISKKCAQLLLADYRAPLEALQKIVSQDEHTNSQYGTLIPNEIIGVLEEIAKGSKNEGLQIRFKILLCRRRRLGL